MSGQERNNRVRSSIDMLPEALRAHINMRLADVTYTYADILEEIAVQGYEVSRSALSRYARRTGKAAMRLQEARQQTEALVEYIRNNDTIEATELATSIYINGLLQRVSTAEDDYDNLDIDKAGRLLVQLQRSAVYKERFAAKRRRDLQGAFDDVIQMLQEDIGDDPELMSKLVERTRALEQRKLTEIEADG